MIQPSSLRVCMLTVCAGLFTLLLSQVQAAQPAAEAYPGQSSNAPWRQQAAEQIEQHRKADLQVRVVDNAGNPIPNATVHIEQQSHAFRFGTAVNARLINADSDDLYTRRVIELFNTATIENGLKWHRWEEGRDAGYSQRHTLAAIKMLRQANLDVRGHVFVWPSKKYFPRDTHPLLEKRSPNEDDFKTVRKRIAKHIESLAAATADDTLYAWDVVNEPRMNHLLMDFLPEKNRAMVDWFQQAKQSAPNAKLFLNEYGILDSARSADGPNQRLLSSQLQELVLAKAPIDGVGLQSHFVGTGSLTSPVLLTKIIDRYASLVDEVQVTEFDCALDDEQLQADYTRDFLTATFSHPAITNITVWGFWERAHWRPKAAFYRTDWSIKPNGQAYLDLVYDQWWSDLDATTNATGQLSARVFKGDYQLTVQHNGGRQVVPVRVDSRPNQRPAELVIKLP